MAEQSPRTSLAGQPVTLASSSSSSSGSVSVEDVSNKTSASSSPAHQCHSSVPVVKIRSSLPPKAQKSHAKNRYSLGKPVSLKEIRSSSVGNVASRGTVKDVHPTENELVSKRKVGHLTNGHIRSSSLSNTRDRLSLYAPSPCVSEEETSRALSSSDVLVNATSPANNNESGPKLLSRKPLVQKSAEKKARKVKFFRNGDKFFKGVVLAVSAEKFRTMDALLSELNRLVGDRVNLHQGVRVLFALDGVKINVIDELLDGESYVCASSDQFKKLDYTKCAEPLSHPRSSRITSGRGTINREAPMISGLGNWRAKRRNNQNNNNSSALAGGVSRTPDQVKPRLITVIRNGSRPRKAVRLLLNKKTAQSFDQVLTDITEAIRPDSGIVRKIFTLDGRQVTCLADFFGTDYVFIAYGNEKFCHDDFDLTTNEIKFLPPFALRSPVCARRVKTAPKKSGPSHTRSGSQGRSPLTANRSRDSLTPTAEQETPDYFVSDSAPLVQVPAAVEVRFDVGRIIGDGNFAVVRECTDRKNGERFALKMIDKKRCQGKEVVLESEVQVLSRVRHPNIVKLFDVIDCDNLLCLVLELVEGGDLFDAIAAAGKFSEPEARKMTLDLVSALRYLHSLNIVHRDVKPENLFVVNLPGGMKSLKLGDFGLAQEVVEPLFTVCGTPTYVAPEILLETGYSLKVDIWATGVILFILLCGYPPFVSPTNDQEELFDYILAGNFEFASPYWDDIGDSAKDLIVLMLQTDPDLRYSAAEVLEHPWLMDEEEWPDLQQCRRLGLHFDTSAGFISGGSLIQGSATSQQQQQHLKPPKPLITAESTPCLHSLQVL